MIPRELQQAIEEILRRNPGASEAQIDALFQVRVRAYNERPQPALGGLSPAQAARVIADAWDGSGVVHLDASLSPADLAASRTLHNARMLMLHLAEAGRVRSTTRGNLPRTSVAALIPRLRWRGDADPETYREFVRNETDAWMLHVARMILQLGGVMKLRTGTFSLTKLGEKLCGESRAGELFATIFRTLFRRVDLNMVAPYGFEVDELQPGIGYALCVFGREPAQWRTPAEIARRVLPPRVLNALSRDPDVYVPGHAVEKQMLRPLEGLGLVEERSSTRAATRIPEHEYRRTPLFERFFRVKF